MAPSAVGTAFPKGHRCSAREGGTLGHLNPPRRPPPAGLRPDTEAQGQLLQLNQQGVGLDRDPLYRRVQHRLAPGQLSRQPVQQGGAALRPGWLW